MEDAGIDNFSSVLGFIRFWSCADFVNEALVTSN